MSVHGTNIPSTLRRLAVAAGRDYVVPEDVTDAYAKGTSYEDVATELLWCVGAKTFGVEDHRLALFVALDEGQTDAGPGFDYQAFPDGAGRFVGAHLTAITSESLRVGAGGAGGRASVNERRILTLDDDGYERSLNDSTRMVMLIRNDSYDWVVELKDSDEDQ